MDNEEELSPLMRRSREEYNRMFGNDPTAKPWDELTPLMKVLHGQDFSDYHEYRRMRLQEKNNES